MASRMPRWIKACVVLVFVAQLAPLAMLISGRLHDSQRNLIPMTVLGGVLALVLLAAYVLLFLPELLSPPDGRLGIVLLTIVAAVLVGVYFWRVLPLLLLPYDLAHWSEPMFLLDIVKLRAGKSLYLPAGFSNSNAYTFGTALVNYSLAWLLRHPTSVVLYRFLQQFYLFLTALFGAASASRLAVLATPERGDQRPRIWFVFFTLILLLFATNANTAVHNVYLHNDPLAWLACAIALWLMINHESKHSPHCFWAMAFMPTLAFLVKQYLLIWLMVYLVYLFFDSTVPARRLLIFAIVSFSSIGLTIGLCYAVWGHPFFFWVFEAMGGFIISFQWLLDRFMDVAWLVALGLLAGWVLLNGPNLRRMVGIFLGWVVLVVTGLYTMGAAQYTTYFAPATLVGGVFFLAALWKLWPGGAETKSPAQDWIRIALSFAITIAVLGGLGHPRQRIWAKSPDLNRYARQIESEFAGLPRDQVLIDTGEWIYLQNNVVMTDLVRTLGGRVDHSEMIDRVRQRHYRKILAHMLPNNEYLYDRHIQSELLGNYREVRRIPAVRDLDGLHGPIMLGDIAVLEPAPLQSGITDPTRALSSSVAAPSYGDRKLEGDVFSH